MMHFKGGSSGGFDKRKTALGSAQLVDSIATFSDQIQSLETILDRPIISPLLSQLS